MGSHRRDCEEREKKSRPWKQGIHERCLSQKSRKVFLHPINALAVFALFGIHSQREQRAVLEQLFTREILREMIKLSLEKKDDGIDLIFGGGEWDGDHYTATVSRESLNPFIAHLQRFAESDSPFSEAWFDPADDWETETERPDLSHSGDAIAKRLKGTE